MTHDRSSKDGSIVTGMPKSSVKKVCVGILHMVLQAPLHSTASKYLHLCILIAEFHFSTFPLKIVGIQCKADGTRRHARDMSERERQSSVSKDHHPSSAITVSYLLGLMMSAASTCAGPTNQEKKMGVMLAFSSQAHRD